MPTLTIKLILFPMRGVEIELSIVWLIIRKNLIENYFVYIIYDTIFSTFYYKF